MLLSPRPPQASSCLPPRTRPARVQLPSIGRPARRGDSTRHPARSVPSPRGPRAGGKGRTENRNGVAHRGADALRSGSAIKWTPTALGRTQCSLQAPPNEAAPPGSAHAQKEQREGGRPHGRRPRPPPAPQVPRTRRRLRSERPPATSWGCWGRSSRGGTEQLLVTRVGTPLSGGHRENTDREVRPRSQR